MNIKRMCLILFSLSAFACMAQQTQMDTGDKKFDAFNNKYFFSTEYRDLIKDVSNLSMAKGYCNSEMSDNIRDTAIVNKSKRTNLFLSKIKKAAKEEQFDNFDIGQFMGMFQSYLLGVENAVLGDYKALKELKVEMPEGFCKYVINEVSKIK